MNVFHRPAPSYLLLRLSGCLHSVGRTACRQCPFWRILKLENLALRRSAEVLQRLRPCRDSVPQEKEKKKNKNCRTGLGALSCLWLHAVWIGNADVQEAAALTWWSENGPEAQGSRTGVPSAAPSLQDLRISRLHTQWRSQNIFTGGGGAQSETIAHAGVARKPTKLSFLVINSSILDRQWLQCGHTTKTCIKKFLVYHTVLFLCFVFVFVTWNKNEMNLF